MIQAVKCIERDPDVSNSEMHLIMDRVMPERLCVPTGLLFIKLSL